MNILLTGASGFIGRNYLLKSKFSSDAHTCIFNQSATFTQWLKEQNNNNITIHKIDLSDSLEIKSIIGKDVSFDVCIYLAANSDPAFSFGHPLEDLYKNAVALINLCNCIKTQKFIYFSSGAVYDGNIGYINPNVKLSPILPYAISKLASEYYLRFFQSIKKFERISIVRFFGAYGPYEAERKIYGKLVKHFGIQHQSDYIIKGDGENFIDAMYIDDTINAIDNLIEDYTPPEVFDLYSGNPLTITELVKRSAHIFGILPYISYKESVSEYIKFVSNDNTYNKRYGNVSKVTLEEGLQLFYQFLMNRR